MIYTFNFYPALLASIFLSLFFIHLPGKATALNLKVYNSEFKLGMALSLPGCTDSLAVNYNSSATEDDGSCQYSQPCIGIMDCNNVCNGTAQMDTCGICAGGTTGIQPNDCEPNELCSRINCDDGNLCTTDTCINGICYYTPLDCDNSCHCNDANPCTTDIYIGQNICQHFATTLRPNYLRTVNYQASWRKVKIGYSSSNLWTPKWDVIAGGNNTLCVTVRTVGEADWQNIQLRIQGKRLSPVKLQNYIPQSACLTESWTKFCIPLNAFYGVDFEQVSFIEFPYSKNAPPFEIHIMKIEFTGGSTPFLWFGDTKTDNYHDGQSGGGGALFAQLIIGGSCNEVLTSDENGSAISLRDETIGLQVYPVPFTDKLLVNFSAENEGAARLRIVNALGQTAIAEIINFQRGENKNTFYLDEHLPGGVYVLELNYGNRTEYRKIFKQVE